MSQREAAGERILSRKEMWSGLHFRTVIPEAEWSIDETERWEVGIPAAPVLHQLGEFRDGETAQWRDA